MSPWERFLEAPQSQAHFAQIYQESDEASLIQNVGRYLWEGLRRGDAALVIATPERLKLLASHLAEAGADVSSLLSTRRLVVFDASRTLQDISVNNWPVWHRFEAIAQAALDQARPAEGRGIRAYGEMVDLLWQARQFDAAIRLEQLWNRMLERSSFSLYCAYAVDVLGGGADIAGLRDVCCTHTHLIPGASQERLESALHQSMDDLLGTEAQALRVRIEADVNGANSTGSAAIESVLWLRKNAPEQAEPIFQLARTRYQELVS